MSNAGLNIGLLQRLEDSPSIYLVGINAQAIYTYVNKRFASRFSFIRQNVVGQHIRTTNQPEDVTRLLQVLEDCQNQPEKVFTTLVKKQTDAGDIFWTYWEVSALEKPTEDGTLFWGIGYDVSESERAHLQASQYARQIESIIENIPSGFVILNENLKIQRLNKAAELLFNSCRKTLINTEIARWVQEEESEGCLFSILNSVKQRRKPQRTECFLQQPEGWFEILVSPGEEGQITLIMRDVTEKRRNEARILESKNKLKAIMDSTSDFNMLIGPDMKILSYNRAAQQTTRELYNRELAEGQNVLDYILPGTVEEFKELFSLALSGITQEVKVKLQFNPQLALWFQVRYYPVHNNEGELIGVAFNSTNIDKQQRQYERLNEIARLYSHEIRRPVATILGITQLINQKQLSFENKEWFGHLKQTTHQLDEVIHAIVEKTGEIEENSQSVPGK